MTRTERSYSDGLAEGVRSYAERIVERAEIRDALDAAELSERPTDLDEAVETIQILATKLHNLARASRWVVEATSAVKMNTNQGRIGDALRTLQTELSRL